MNVHIHGIVIALGPLGIPEVKMQLSPSWSFLLVSVHGRREEKEREKLSYESQQIYSMPLLLYKEIDIQGALCKFFILELPYSP